MKEKYICLNLTLIRNSAYLVIIFPITSSNNRPSTNDLVEQDNVPRATSAVSSFFIERVVDKATNLDSSQRHLAFETSVQS